MIMSFIWLIWLFAASILMAVAFVGVTVLAIYGGIFACSFVKAAYELHAWLKAS